MEQQLKKLAELALQCGCTILENESMQKHTTFKIGGPAQYFVKAETVQAVSAVREFCTRENIPCLTVGRGSNLLVSDRGIDGVVLQLSGEFEKIVQDGNDIICGAGASLSALAKFAQNAGLTGGEFLWGIPGSVGGAVFMNAGAYGGELSQLAVASEYVTPEGRVGRFTVEEMKMSYRHSIYHDLPYTVLSVRLHFEKGNREDILARMEDLIARRKEKQPLEYPSAGSTFKRPEGYFAAALIEECGLKGASVGGAQVSQKHSGFIINKGGATCEDVERLIAQVQKTVFEKKGVSLECEIKTVGR